MGHKLKKAPVYFVICQVNFNAVFSFKDSINQIQDSFRKNGYSDVKQEMFQTFLFPTIKSNSESNFSIEESARYIFCNMNKDSGFILNSSSLSFLTTNYHDHDSFFKPFFDNLESLHQIFNFEFTDRVGLRYLDAVFDEDEKHDPMSFLVESVQGLPQVSNDELVYSFCETAFKRQNVDIVTRTMFEKGPITIPPDLMPSFLNIHKRFSSFQGRHALIDTDGSISTRQTFECNNVKSHLELIHSLLYNVFETTVTSKAFEYWKES
jgi:uncharacterized protein (TIGR04255 family)